MLQTLDITIAPEMSQVTAPPSTKYIIITVITLQKDVAVKSSSDPSSLVPPLHKEAEHQIISSTPPMPSIDDLIYNMFQAHPPPTPEKLQFEVND